MRDIQIPGFLDDENNFDQISCNFQNLLILLLKFSDENHMTKLLVDI